MENISMNPNIIKDYEKRIIAAQQKVNYYKKLVNTYSLSRLGAFLLFVLVVVLCAIDNQYILLEVSTFLFIVLFGWLVSKQSKYEVEKTFFQNLQTVNENEIANMLTRSNIYDNGQEYYNEKHYYTSDLDIFGQSSLFQLVNRAATPLGNEKLATWLNVPSVKELILKRQQSVQELGSKLDWKMDFQASILFAVKQEKNQLKQLFAYLRIATAIPGEKWLISYAKIAPWLLLASIVATVFYHNTGFLIVLIALINNRITSSKGEYIEKADLVAGKMGKVLGNYALIFSMIENENFESEHCNAIAERLKSKQNGSVSANIKTLSKLINKLNIRLNMVLGALFNMFLLWSVKQVIAIEIWKRNNQQSLEDAFEAVAEFEALLSIAGLYINYPDWCFPEIADGDGYTLTAAGIAHPLINSLTRVENDYELNDTLKIDIITGSNMAGKSTFLRTLGINTILALCGAPVCAKSMRVSVMTIISYMRIKDSLNESTSTFKAELDRLQMLLGAVGGDEKVYFLIDEMLRGTNSVDKYKGSKAVIEQLIRKRGVGLVATHDLQIALLEEKYPDYVRNFYFDIQVKDGEMLFDYKIKHGECKTFNASLLLKQIGIDVDAD
ncbi:MutS-related protein [Mucilaginibacter paludis]|uniref:DNA mismatch repair protein MutS domain protein n=1 Tax=Mucilaginibacter paludis DSM 18603 TaxID=714943 RepID=H1Y521_9SPHI|nr:DNA mismatch repair protein MutS domain protein [Mucilaginibacter paludis]EHQ28564.1 DNA mismatch repair protein MutS domain protein [Mucilaginibacter paludis DSM 18603]